MMQLIRVFMGMGEMHGFPSNWRSFHRVQSLPRMTSQTRAIPFLQKTRKNTGSSKHTGQILSGSMLAWVLHLASAVGTGFNVMPCGIVPLPVDMHNHVPGHQPVMEPWVKTRSALQGWTHHCSSPSAPRVQELSEERYSGPQTHFCFFFLLRKDHLTWTLPS